MHLRWTSGSAQCFNRKGDDMSWRLHPEVAGELGEYTRMNAAVHPPEVYALHHRFEGWLGDDLLECFPCFLVTKRLAHALHGSSLTGWKIGPVQITLSPEFEELYPGRRLPEFRWLQVGRDPKADLYLSSDHTLVVSDEAMKFLRRFSISNAEVVET